MGFALRYQHFLKHSAHILWNVLRHSPPTVELPNSEVANSLKLKPLKGLICKNMTLTYVQGPFSLKSGLPPNPPWHNSHQCRVKWPLPFMGGARSSHSSTLPCDWSNIWNKKKSGPFPSWAQDFIKTCSLLAFSWAMTSETMRLLCNVSLICGYTWCISSAVSTHKQHLGSGFSILPAQTPAP